MSSSGKTHWGRRFAQAGYKWICIDDRIARKLYANHNVKTDNIREMSQWLGFAYEKGFKEKEQLYLKYEEEATGEALDRMENNPTQKILLDTTGSVVYLSQEILRRMQVLSRVVCMEIPEHRQEEMYKNFIQHPKPIVWADMYSEQKNETRKQALKRSYQQLLNHRLKYYRQLCQVSLPFELRIQSDFTVNDFLDYIK